MILQYEAIISILRQPKLQKFLRGSQGRTLLFIVFPIHVILKSWVVTHMAEVLNTVLFTLCKDTHFKYIEVSTGIF